MDFFKSWGNALSRPFKRTFQGFSQVFTNPTKANLGDWISVALPGWGGTIVNDVKNPQDVGFQAMTLAALAGGAHLVAPAAPKAAAAPVVNESGVFVGDLTARSVPTLELSSKPGVFTLDAAAWRAPNAAELAAQRGLAPAAESSLLADVGAAFKATGKVTKDLVLGTATLSTAVRNIAQPWERAVDSFRDAVAGAPAGGSSGGTQLSVTAGGSSAPGSAAPAVDTEAAPPPGVPGELLAFGALALLVMAAAWAWKRWRKA
jgi:hypothetical protein